MREIQRYDGQRQWTERYQLKKNKWIKWEELKGTCYLCINGKIEHGDFSAERVTA